MVTIIKNQLLKHLSRFTKNLSPEQISVSALKGQGSLSSLQLDEAVLTELLELPPWIRLASATCGHATFRVHWTKLKNMPIELNLEDVQIIVETCAEPRGGTNSSPVTSPAVPPARYSFIHKVIDGISISVNTVKIQFTTPVFVATVQLSRISVESRTPQWQKGDLRLTRLKDPRTAQILIFKEVSWLSARIEAHAVKEGGGLPPLRLLTNQSYCRITIKKRLSDCFVVGSRLVLILEEALWVLTDRQLGAALAFADSLAGLAKNASAQVTREKAQRKLETLPEYLAQVSQSQGRTPNTSSKSNRSTDTLARLFSHHDVAETSYHFLSQKIDLHLCDDPGLGRSSHPSLTAGAAFQVTLNKLQFDYYPYHLAAGDRNRWPGYRESASPHSQWLKQALTAFRGSLLSLLDSRSHKSSVSDENGEITTETSMRNTPSSPKSSIHAGSGSTSPARAMIIKQLASLMTTCVILRLEDFTLFKVTTGERREIPKSFICGDRERFTVPDEVRSLHVEFTHFYYPGNVQFPVPSPKLYIQINPVKITFDLASCLWCNSFVLNLLNCIKTTQVANMEGEHDLVYIDVTAEAIMPRVIVESGKEHPGQRDRPRSLHAQVSRATITNSQGAAGGGGELTACLTAYAASELLQRFCCTDTMLKHAAGDDCKPVSINKEALTSRILWGSPRTVWCVRLEPVWADFCGARASPSKPTPFLDAVPFTLWVYLNLEDNKIDSLNNLENVPKDKTSNTRYSDKEAQTLFEKELIIDGEADMQVVAQCTQLVSIQLNHYQYLLILRLAERLTELAAFLALDAARVSGPSVRARSMVVGCIIPQVEITLVLPSCCPGKESSRDLDSVVPDSSSLMDLHQTTGSGTLCNQPQGNGSSNILSQNSLERHSVYISSLPSSEQHPLTSLEPDPQLENRSASRIGNSSRHSGDWVDYNKQDMDKSSTSVQSKDNLTNFNPFTVSMRKGLTTFMNSVEAALKPSDQNTFGHGASSGPSPNAGPSIADQWDSLSIASSDSDKYVMVQLAGDQEGLNSFKLWEGSDARAIDGAVEVAAEVVEHSSSPSERSLASSCRRRDLVSMSTFKLKHVEVLQLSRGFCSRLFANVGDVIAEECSSIPWDELQSKFVTRSRGWSDSVGGLVADRNQDDFKSKISVHLDHYPHCLIPIPYEITDTVSLDSIMGSFSEYVNVKVQDVNLTLNMSTVMGLSDLIEDEVIVSPIPMEVYLENISLKLNEDRPASSISSPGALPVKLCLSGLKIIRSIDGIINLEPSSISMNSKDSSSEFKRRSGSDTESVDVKHLSDENELLKRRLNALERLALENDSLRRSKEEVDILKALLLTAQDQVAALLDEKATLLDTVRTLQEQASGIDIRGASSMWGRHNKR